MLSAFNLTACQEGRWKSLRFNNGLIAISHMAFIDDIVLFGVGVGVASLCNVQNMLKVIDELCSFLDNGLISGNPKLFVQIIYWGT